MVHCHVEQGVEANDLPAVGHGKNKPVADNGNEAGRSLSRRAELRMVLTGPEHVWQPLRRGQRSRCLGSNVGPFP